MSESTTKKSTAQKAREAGAKTPDDKKKAASAKLKAMRAEAAEGDVVIELHGETLTVHLEDELVVRRNLPFATQKLIEKLG